jgi:DNA-binding response OmpR family regulator
MKILVVEDEPKTGDYLRQGLIEAGFALTWRATGWTACTWASRVITTWPFWM